MDKLSFGSLCLVALATVLLSLVLKRALGAKETGRPPKLPPGPWNLPVIGSLHHLVGAPPHRALLGLSRRHGPLMLLRLGEVPTVIVSSSEAAKEVMKAHDPVFASRPCGGTIDVVSFAGRGIVLAPYGEHWRQVRKVCVSELLSARQVKRMESIREEEVARLVESVVDAAAASPSSSGAVVNLTQALSTLTNNIIARAVFGARFKQQEAYLRELDVVATLVAGFSLVDLFPSSRLVRWLSRTGGHLRRSHARIQRILDEVIQERKEEKFSGSAGAKDDDDDLLDVLLRLQKEDALTFPLTAEIVCAVIFDIFGAATDTTASTLEWAMAELMRNPQTMERAKLEVRERLGRGRSMITGADLGNLHYPQMIIKEALRLHPTIALILRASQKSCQIMGYDIPKGTFVSINVFAIARDPTYWDDADKFKPERFENISVDYKTDAQLRFIPFGAGRRQCPGALFATTTMELAMANLLYHFDWALLDEENPGTLDMTEVFGITMHRRSHLRLQATPVSLVS